MMVMISGFWLLVMASGFWFLVMVMASGVAPAALLGTG